MTKQAVYRLGDLQLRIMKILWKCGPSNVAQVQKRLDSESLAYTTIATMLRKMEDRQLVTHKEEGRKYIYGPMVTEDAVTRSMANDLVDRLFEGSLAQAVSHLLRTREVSPKELGHLEQLIEQHKQQ